MARRTRGTLTNAYGPAVVDGRSANDTLADAERALRQGDARGAEETYLQALGKLGPFADPRWRSGDALDARTRAQCHARLAAIAFDEADYDRSLRETALAGSARHEAIAFDRCTGDDIRFMITALVHSATVLECLGAHAEALEASAVALDFSRFARTQDHDPTTRRSIAAAQRAAARLHRELETRAEQVPAFDVTDAEIDLTEPAWLDIVETQRPEGAANQAGPDTVAVKELAIDELVIDLTDQPRPTPAQTAAAGTLEELGLPDDVTDTNLVTGRQIRPEETFADLIDLTEAAPEVPEPTAAPDLLDAVTAAARAESSHRGPDPRHSARFDALTDNGSGDEGPADDDRFTRPQRRAERRMAHAATDPATDPATTPAPEGEADAATGAVSDDAPGRVFASAERRQDERAESESAAQLVARSRRQALLARMLMGQSDGEATINAHRAVRTATRARQWAREDPNAIPVVALNLIEALVIRGDALVNTGHDEVARTDLRRARAIVDQLWQACPTGTHAAAVVLVSVRSAVIDRAGRHEQLGTDHLAQARLILSQARALELALPIERAADDGPLDELLRDDQADDLAGLRHLGDRLLDYLQAMDQDLDELDTDTPAVAVS